MFALRSEATCRLGKKAATHRRTLNLLWAGPISAPQDRRSPDRLFGGLETPKVFASGRPLLAHVDSSIAREVDRPLRRAMLNKSRLRRHYFSIEPRTLSGLDPPSRATRIGSCIFPGQKIPQKIQKTVLHLFSGLVTSAQNVGDFRGKNRGKKKFKKNQKKCCIYFPVLIQAGKSRTNFGAKKV